MDLPVVLIKLRDYIFWFGPVYLIAIALGATAELALTRRLGLNISGEGSASAHAGLLHRLWWYLAGRPLSPPPLSFRLYIWLGVSSRSLSWVALLMTAALSWPLSLLRIGAALILASLLAALVPLFVSAKSSQGTAAPIFAHEFVGPGPSVAADWWRALKQRFDQSINDVTLGAVLAGVLIGLTGDTYALLAPGLEAPLYYLSGPVIGTLSMLAPGPDAPIIAALQTRGLEGVAFTFMLAVCAAPLGLVIGIKKLFGLRTAAVYTLVSWVMVAAAAWLLNLVLST
ncbi:MAG: hypothetical protein ABIO92_01240 [Chloroflexia bacterium]